MSGQYPLSRFVEPSWHEVRTPVILPASLPRKVVVAALDVALVAAPLTWGQRMLADQDALGWVGIGLGSVLLLLQVVVPWATARTLAMSVAGLKMLEPGSGDPVRGSATLLRHVWPPARGEVCDVRTHVAAADAGRPSDTIVPPVGPRPLPLREVSGTLISQVPRGTTGPPSGPAVPVVRSPEPTPPTATVPRPSTRPEVVAGPRAVDERTLARAPGPSRPTEPARRSWTVRFDTGPVVQVDGVVLLGRAPVDEDGSGAVLVAIADPQRSLSKSHARLRRTGATVTVEDLDSTNGVVVLRAGVYVDLAPGQELEVLDGDEIYFGELRACVSTHEPSG